MDDKKEIINILDKIINDFSIDNLVRLFQNKTTKFRMLQSRASQPLFTDGLLLGEFGCGDESVCIFTFKTHQPLTERSSKKAQYELAKKMLKEQIRYDGGFFIFYDEQGNFRFSLIYDIPLSSGTREWSNFKRYTYYVGKEQTNKTFIQQMAEADFSSLNSIIKAFSVEKVTREFYNDIANWYFWALQKVQFPKDAEQQSNGRNIALIRFITRIIFVWFMKEKKLISPQLFDFDHIKNILKSTDDNESTYYKAILQNLFFATLNTPIPERKFRTENRFQGKNEDYMNHEYFRYQELFSDPKQDINLLFNEIPFLNGGLFECLDKPKDDPSNDTGNEIRMDGFSDKKENQPIFPNELFFSKEKNVDLTEYYGDTKYKNTRVQGLISILNAYNFTVDENTPLDEEVALDPELLGKVFENLLASYNPETATTARKATGSYYTPREIVDYMVTESLKYYFKTNFENTFPTEKLDEKLTSLFSYSHEEQPFNEKETDFIIEKINELKIIDPAVGSGAFPIGVLNKLVFLLSKLDSHNEKWKAQQFRALDYITDPTLKNELREKIENNFKRNELDYGRKLYLIQNCIYGVDIQPIAIHIAKLRFFISLLVDEKINPNIDDNFGIEPLPNLETKLVAANTLIGLPKSKQLVIKSDETKQIEAELFQIRKQHFTANYEKKKKEIQKRDRELRNRLKELLEESGFPSDYTEKIASWDLYDTNRSAEWFDPEWMFGVKNGFDMVIGNPPYIQLQKAIDHKCKHADLYKDQNFKTFERPGDIYCLFYEKGISLLKKDGLLCYITSNKWMRAGYGEKLRKFFLQYNPKILMDLGPNVFQNTTVDTNILIIQKTENQHQLCAVTITENKKNNLNLADLLKRNSLIISNLTSDAWFIGSDAEQRLKEKIEHIGKPLKDWDVNIYRGVLTGLNEAFIIDSAKRKEILNNCRDEEERRRTEAIIKPILRGRDIKRYYYEWAGLWVIGTFPALKLNIEDYPALKKYFLDHFDIRQLEQSGKKYPELGFNARKKTTNKWFEVQDTIAYYPEFEKEKIIYPNMTKFLPFVIDSNQMYVNQKCFILTSDKAPLKYLVAYFNSSVSNMWIKNNCPELQGGTRELSFIFFQKIPLPPITPTNELIVHQIESLADNILSSKKENPQTETDHWEKEIDKCIYKLYDLTEEEIKIIEGEK
jgi:type I restriction-modification system DNA methylase subunit